jgi:hypothetical protein
MNTANSDDRAGVVCICPSASWVQHETIKRSSKDTGSNTGGMQVIKQYRFPMGTAYAGDLVFGVVGITYGAKVCELSRTWRVPS